MDPDVFKALIEQAPDALIFCDAAGVIRVWNAAAETLFGHPAAEALGASLDMIIPERLRDAHWAGFHRALGSGVPKYHGQVLTTRASHPSGERLYVDLSFALIRDSGGAIVGVLGAARRSAGRPASPDSAATAKA